MAQLSPQKRKKRRVQLREAQRRRRARLKEESKSFLQIILRQEILSALRNYSDLVGKPLHSCAAELIEAGLGIQQVHEKQKEEPQQPPRSEDVLEQDGESADETGQVASPEGSANAVGKSTGQMDPFSSCQ
ncbi:MAG TPA: hypothetical protein VK673_02765 [Chthoniobacterales bacterium]|nr:hypothetical protein [Chthoniobacterales bacterium]